LERRLAATVDERRDAREVVVAPGETRGKARPAFNNYIN
jgi:hypothetical protein